MAALDALVLRSGHPRREAPGALPVDMITGTGAEPRPRLRVDSGQTSFWEGRQFRTFHEFNVGSGTSIFGRFITIGDVIVRRRSITVAQGNLRFALSQGGTPGGTFTAKTVYPVNSMANRPAPVYTVKSLAAFGGTLTGQTELDVAMIETGTTQAVSVENIADEVGLAAGTYYVEIRNTGASVLRGIYSVLWEEYMPRSVKIFP